MMDDDVDLEALWALSDERPADEPAEPVSNLGRSIGFVVGYGLAIALAIVVLVGVGWLAWKVEFP